MKELEAKLRRMKMTHKQRFINSLLLKEVDKLPHGDQMIHDELVAKIVGKSLQGDDGNALYNWVFNPISDDNFIRHKKAREFLSFDWVQVFPREPLIEIGETGTGYKMYKDIWGAVLKVSPESFEFAEKPIKAETEIIKYEFPDINIINFDNILKWVQDGQFAVAAQIDTGFFKINQLTGFEEYMYYINYSKCEMHTLMEKFIDYEMRLADRLIDLGIDVIWLGNDFAFNSGPFISPEMLYEFDFKYMQILVEHIHKRGVPVVLHCCGNINQTIELIISTGINAIHALQPSAHNDIYEYKRKYGKDVCFIGNMDINELLTLGSPYEIDQKVKELVEHLFNNRTGWVMSTCNLLNLDIPVENAIAMHLAAEKYGR